MKITNIKKAIYTKEFTFALVFFSVNSLIMKYFTGTCEARYMALATGIGALLKLVASYIIKKGGKRRRWFANHLWLLLMSDVVITASAFAIGYNNGNGACRYILMTLSQTATLIVNQLIQEQINNTWSGAELTEVNQTKSMASNAGLFGGTAIGVIYPDPLIVEAMCIVVVITIFDSFMSYMVFHSLKK